MVFRFLFFSSGALIYIPWDLTFFFVVIVDGLSYVVTNKAHTKSGPGKKKFVAAWTASGTIKQNKKKRVANLRKRGSR
jgi:hypothetical protein